jgi:putative aldouronate transport system permease protein
MKRNSIGSLVFDNLNRLLMVVVIIVMIYPFWNTVVVSFNDALDTVRGSLYFWPRIITTYNYINLFASGTLYRAFLVSVERSLLSMVLNVFLSAMLAYILSRKDFVLNKFLTVYMVLTMYVSAGLIPTYFLFRGLGLINNFWVYILPGLVGAFNVIVIRTFIRTIPESLSESAKIDGAGEFRIFLQIILPLCMPVLACVALWVVVGSWNSWFDTFIFASSKQKLSTLSYEMMKLLASSMVQTNSVNAQQMAEQAKQTRSNMVTPTSIRAAITIVASVPILITYPFLQKYFVAGLNLGSVKE